MKKINTYIIERLTLSQKKNFSDINYDYKMLKFTLEESERDSLCELVGYASGMLGDEEDFMPFEDFRMSLNERETDDLENLFDLLDNYENYKKITNKNILENDINVLLKLSNYLEDFDDNDEYKDALDNILFKMIDYK